jgi:hypothetical protein
MAIISIPTSIGGINIPGSVLAGPLGSLYKKNGLDYVRYPRDLESSTRSHVVLFTIKDRKGITVEEVKKAGGNVVGAAKGAYEKGVTETTKDIVNRASSVTVEGTIESANQIRKNITEVKTENVGYIALYMPETMQFTYSPQYDDNLTLSQAASALPKIGKAISFLTTAAQSDLARVALNKAGYVFNPNQQLLFQGITFREFQMSFTFTPYSRSEKEAVNKIINMFRSYAAPTIMEEAAGMFFKAPAVFDIDFQFNGVENTNVPKFKTSVIKNVDVNYAPNGWSTHSDGSPVQTILTLDFQEIYLVDRKDIQGGY